MELLLCVVGLLLPVLLRFVRLNRTTPSTLKALMFVRMKLLYNQRHNVSQLFNGKRILRAKYETPRTAVAAVAGMMAREQLFFQLQRPRLDVIVRV